MFQVHCRDLLLTGSRLVLAVWIGATIGNSTALAQVSDERLIPLAEVDTHTISLGLFKKSYVDYLIASGANDSRALRYQHLEAMIDTYLLGDYAKSTGLVDDHLFQAFIEQQRRDALGGRYYELHVLDQVEGLTEAEKRRAFAFSRDKVHVRQLYFRREAAAWAAYNRLEEGEDFVVLANEIYQTAAFDSSAGDMGLITYFELDDALGEAAFNLKTRYEYTTPIQSRNGFHILRLENRYRNPILTEYEYQTHGPGIGEEMALRKIRMEGDAFVRELMDRLNYQVHSEAVQALTARVRSIVEKNQPATPVALNQEEVIGAEAMEDIWQALTPSTVLVEYNWAGQQRVFTAADFFRWLPDLPFEELRQNPPASVGRALRNEVLGMAGAREGLAIDLIVMQSVTYQSQIFLARALREQIRQDTSIVPDELLIQQAFDRIIKDRKKSIVVDFWAIPCENLESARNLLAEIEQGKAEPEKIAGYVWRENIDISQHPAWQRHLRQAPLSQPMVVGMQGEEGNERWAVFEIHRRQETEYTLDEMRSSLKKQLAPYAGEYYTLRALYEKAHIEVDTTLVEQLTTGIQ